MESNTIQIRSAFFGGGTYSFVMHSWRSATHMLALRGPLIIIVKNLFCIYSAFKSHLLSLTAVFLSFRDPLIEGGEVIFFATSSKNNAPFESCQANQVTHRCRKGGYSCQTSSHFDAKFASEIFVESLSGAIRRRKRKPVDIFKRRNGKIRSGLKV